MDSLTIMLMPMWGYMACLLLSSIHADYYGKEPPMWGSQAFFGNQGKRFARMNRDERLRIGYPILIIGFFVFSIFILSRFGWVDLTWLTSAFPNCPHRRGCSS